MTSPPNFATDLAAHPHHRGMREALALRHFEGGQSGMSAVEFGAFLQAELARWSKAVRETGAKLE